MRVDVGQAVFGGLQFLSADVLRAMQDLSLQIAVIDDVEIDQPQPPDAGRRQIQTQRRTQSARADQKRARGLQFALTFQPDFGQNQVAVVASQFVFVQFGQFCQRLFYRGARAAGYRRDDADLVLLFDRGVFFLQVADVFVVDVDVDEAAQLAVGVEEMFPQIGKLRDQFVERFADLRRFDRDRRLALGILAQSCRDRNGWHDVFSSEDQPRRNEEGEDFSCPFFALFVSSWLIFILLLMFNGHRVFIKLRAVFAHRPGARFLGFPVAHRDDQIRPFGERRVFQIETRRYRGMIRVRMVIAPDAQVAFGRFAFGAQVIARIQFHAVVARILAYVFERQYLMDDSLAAFDHAEQ